MRPTFDAADARRLAAELFGVDGSAHALPGYVDQNFRIDAKGGRRFVLKLANSDEARAQLEWEHRMRAHVAERDPELGCPPALTALSGESLTTADGHLVRMLPWVDGVPLANVSPRTPELLASLGAHLGRLDCALADVAPPPARGAFAWDLANAAETAASCLEHVGDRTRRALLARRLDEFAACGLPLLARLRKSVIQNDANDHNVLVSPVGTGPLAARERHAVAVIDFGDAVSSCTVFEVAIAAAYCTLDEDDPLAAAAAVVAGYHGANPLTEEELGELFLFLQMRLCVSVTMSAHQRALDPDNEYLSVTEAPGWRALEILDGVHPTLARATFRHACGLEPCPETSRVEAWLRAHADTLGPVLDPELASAKKVIVDLSPESADFGPPREPAEVAEWDARIRALLEDADARVGIGRYGEPRTAYTGEQFASGPEPRTVHLGLDLFVPAGSVVRAPLDAIVHSVADNTLPLDYGPTVILEHHVEPELTFFTLYGHLARESVAELSRLFSIHGLKIPTVKSSRFFLCTSIAFSSNGKASSSRTIS